MNEEPRPGSSIPDELNKLGRQLAEAARLAWESEDRKRLQAELSEGLRRFGDQVETTVQQARENDTTRQLGEQAQKVATKVQETRVIDEVRDGLVTGLAGLNREVSKLLDRLAERTVATPSAVTEPSAAAEPIVPPADVPPAENMGPGDPVI